MNAFRLALRSLAYFWRIHLAVALAVMTASAVLSGALMVGDSVRHSLRTLMLDRLGRIHSVLMADHYFAEELALRMAQDEGFSDRFSAAVPVILISNATVEVAQGDGSQRVADVQLLGIGPEFWRLADPPGPPPAQLAGRQALINRTLADQLQLRSEQELIVRLPEPAAVAGDNVMANRENRIRSITGLEVAGIAAAQGLGRFSLSPTQQELPLVFLPRQLLQDALDKPAQVNAIAVARQGGRPESPGDVLEVPRRAVHPTLEDLAVQLQTVERTYRLEGETSDRTAYQYLHLTTQRMVFSPEAESVLRTALESAGAEPVITYLANSIERLDDSGNAVASVPYSTVSAVQADGSLSPLRSESGEPLGPMSRDEIVLNSWTAEQLGADPGDRIRLRYFDPETAHGQAVEHTADFRLAAVVPLVRPAAPYRFRRPAQYQRPPGWANDPDLTPSVEGITDQQSIDDWDPPFPFDQRRIRSADEQYWENYRTTPKAFISLAQGRDLWGSRFGAVTSYRIPISSQQTEESVRQALETAVADNVQAFGFAWLPLLHDGLTAASGTTPFEGLFLGFSLFIIVAAMLLIALLFRLGVEQRSREAGTLLALGLTGKQVARQFLLQGAAIAVVASIAGVVAAIGYAALMILGLKTLWLAAVVTPFIELHVEPRTAVVGAVSGIAVSLAAIGWTCWRLGRQPIRALLGGPLGGQRPTRTRRIGYPLAILLTGFAVALGFWGLRLGGEGQAGAFIGVGVCMLAAALIALRQWLTQRAARGITGDALTLRTLAERNLVRNPGRSLLTVGLLASACFLIVAISAFRLPPSREGTGGFQWIGQSDRPIFADLQDPAARQELLGPDAELLRDCHILALRMVDGDDASCRNLYQVARPRILGVPPGMQAYFDPPQSSQFRWAAAADESANPWRLLSDDLGDGVIPVVLDRNTAVYSLHLTGGIGQEFAIDYGDGRTLRFRVVGLLANSILQGSLLVSEAHLLQAFPNLSGYRYFLIASPEEDDQRVAAVLQRRLRDYGFYAQDARRVLQQLLAVQNTYLSTFQTLGGLGLLLGTVGLAAVQFRSVLERRGELAVMLSLGFARSRLARLVLTEHAMLLLSGLAVGWAAAMVAILPHQWAGGAGVQWPGLLGILAGVLVTGMAAGWWAVRQSLQTPLLEALRPE